MNAETVRNDLIQITIYPSILVQVSYTKFRQLLFDENLVVLMWIIENGI